MYGIDIYASTSYADGKKKRILSITIKNPKIKINKNLTTTKPKNQNKRRIFNFFLKKSSPN